MEDLKNRNFLYEKREVEAGEGNFVHLKSNPTDGCFWRVVKYHDESVLKIKSAAFHDSSFLII